ncbi:ABC transporter ATP-binding protein [Roseiconus nitratireducens]|uniref:ABC transporter ATP-binding protein n=1 Tax=Roseiconus nitratireducens TaxID=2605748 RepID=A0A5M6CVT2_9BACT|nr:ABC transporter ATP-binding protein [Roseiconus nitratireducens]KAA5539341.1 ABC transporter ATP-binding protein [Roseiconus nitratireducens]
MNRLRTLAAARHEPQASQGWLPSLFWAALAGILVPMLVLLVGLISKLMETGRLDDSTVQLGVNLFVWLPESFVQQPPLGQLSRLVALGFLITLVFCFAVWRHRRLADRRAAAIVKGLHEKVLRQSVRRAELEGAAAQSVNAQKLIGRQLPLVQNGLSLWYRSIPRSVILLVGCVAVALLVHVWLAVMAVLSGAVVWRLYNQVYETDLDESGKWELPQLRAKMAALVGKAPKMARLQTEGLAEQTFRTELDLLYQRLAEEDARRGRIWPILFLAVSTATAIMILGLGLNLFESDSGLSLSSAVVLALALVGAISAVWRLLGMGQMMRHSAPACDAVYAYLRRSDEIAPSEQRIGFAGLRQGVEFRDVTLSDSHGQPILKHVTTDFSPRSLVALLGTDSVSPQAMVELLMGFGRPSQGEVRIDGLPLLDLHPASLAKNVMWIEPSGPLWEGTIEENLAGGDSTIGNADIVDALREVDAYEQVQRLADGLGTYASEGETSLSTEATYAIGIARALLHRPPILLVGEPPAPSAHSGEDPCLKAICKLRDQGSLVVLLPRRLQSLRSADRVILLNGASLAGEGKHAELLNDSDLYRHLNYLLFNPYRHGR